MSNDNRNKKLRLVWVGCHEEGILAFKGILEKGYDIVKFITLNDEAFSKRSAGTREYADLCKNYNVPINFISTIKNEEAYNLINDVHPDLLIVLGWSEIVPERILNIQTIGTVGTHAAMLPHNRGSAPVNWALIKGETEGGNSLMWLDKNVDQGEIIDQIGFDITPYDTCKTLYDKVSVTNEIMLLRLVERLSAGKGTVMRKENVTNEAILPRRRPQDGLINWNQAGKNIYNFVRALTKPYPGAFTYLNGKKYYVWNASVLPAVKNNDNCGAIVGPVYNPTKEACGVLVACLDGYIIVHDLEDECGNVFNGKELIELNLKGNFGDLS